MLPAYGDYVSPANPGTRTRQHVNNGYFMQTVDVIKDRITIGAGGTYSYIETTTNTNMALRNPFTSTNAAETKILYAHAFLHFKALGFGHLPHARGWTDLRGVCF